jgi:hypothetical protein
MTQSPWCDCRDNTAIEADSATLRGLVLRFCDNLMKVKARNFAKFQAPISWPLSKLEDGG